MAFFEQLGRHILDEWRKHDYDTRKNMSTTPSETQEWANLHPIKKRIARIRSHFEEVRQKGEPAQDPNAIDEAIHEGIGAEQSIGERRGSVFRGLQLFILQGSPFCNIDCTYCYLPNRLDKSRMSLDTVRACGRFLRGIKIDRERLVVLWHCGEPMALPISFYREAMRALEETAGMPLRHLFQTNGTLIDDEWCAFFKEYEVEVSLSIDGPESIHDARRITRSGRGTFATTMRGVETLKRKGIAFDVLAVVTADTLARQSEACDFFATLGAKGLNFNVEEIQGANRATTLSTEALQSELAQFFDRVTSATANGKERIREITLMRDVLGAPPGYVGRNETYIPGSIVSVDVKGNVSTFSPELVGMSDVRYGAFSWGNVHEHKWDDIVRNPRFLRVYKDIVRGVEQCRRTCPYFELCGGGVPSSKWSENGSFATAETLYCKLHIQTVADVVMRQVEVEAGL